MKHAEIPVGDGRFALVSVEDLPIVQGHKWRAYNFKSTFYAVTGSTEILYMHRMVCGFPDGMDVDHLDANGLNNTRENLVPMSHSLNVRRAIGNRKNTSGFRGVCWDKGKGKWKSYMQLNGRLFNIGRHDTAVEAALAYDRESIRLFGEFGPTNFGNPLLRSKHIPFKGAMVVLDRQISK